MEMKSVPAARQPTGWTRWRIHGRARRGRPVRDPAYASYAIAFAERELQRCGPLATVLICLAVVGFFFGAAVDSAALFGASGGLLGAGISYLTAPRRLRRSIQANDRFLG